MAGRPWTKRELAYLNRWYSRRTAAEIAEHLRRSVKAIWQAAVTHGLVTSNADCGPKLDRFIRQKHKQGWTDPEIAEAWGCDRHTVARHRALLGLASNKGSQRYRQRVAKRTQEQCKAAGLENLAQVRSQAFRRYAAAQGWPADLRPRHVHILNLLYEQGPKTRRQIADSIGLSWPSSRKALKSSDPEGSYLAHLIRRGLVVRIVRGHKVTGQGKGRSCDVYAVPPSITRGIE